VRARADEARIRSFLRELGRRAEVEVTAYLTGGATAVLYGWRSTTIDVDIRLEPDDDRLLRALPELKERLDINIELAAPTDFIPELPGWRDRSPFIAQEHRLIVRHFDPYSQALAKLERDHPTDRLDVAAMLERGLIEPGRAVDLYGAIEPQLYRYPAIDPAAFRARVERVFHGVHRGESQSPDRSESDRSELVARARDCLDLGAVGGRLEVDDDPHRTVVAYVLPDACFEVELDWREMAAFGLVCRTVDAGRPGGYYMLEGQRVRVHLLDALQAVGLIDEHEAARLRRMNRASGPQAMAHQVASLCDLLRLHQVALAQAIDVLLPSN
jgi:hypothetical protein